MLKGGIKMSLPVVEGTCNLCGSDVLCDFPKNDDDCSDYWYHCVNEDCINSEGIGVGDMEIDNVDFIIWNRT